MTTATNITAGTGRILVWDLPVRIFHWTLAGTFAAAYVLSESERLRAVHVTLGWTVLGLVAFRLVWGFVGSRWARFSSFAFGPRAVAAYLRQLAAGRPPRHVGHNPAGSWAVYAILALAALTGITGWCNYEGIGGDALEELHEGLAATWLALVGLHVAGVVVSSWLHRENLARAMITGWKDGTAAESAGAPRRLAGATLAAAVAGFWAWSALAGGVPWTNPAGERAAHDAGSGGYEGHERRETREDMDD